MSIVFIAIAYNCIPINNDTWLPCSTSGSQCTFLFGKFQILIAAIRHTHISPICYAFQVVIIKRKMRIMLFTIMFNVFVTCMSFFLAGNAIRMKNNKPLLMSRQYLP